MIPSCSKCQKEFEKNPDALSVWTQICRCKLKPTPKSPKGSLNRHQRTKLKYRYFKFKKIGWLQRPKWAQIF